MKKTLALLLAALMLLGILAGCSSAPAETPTDTPAADAPVNEPAEAPADEPADEPADVPEDEPADAPADEPAVEAPATEDTVNPVTGYSTGGLTLPLCEEPTTISVFTDWSNSYINSPGEVGGVMKAAEYTNVQVEWNTYSAAEQFPLYIAAQEFDDIINAMLTTYTGGIDKAIEDECYVDGTPYLQYMPNFSRLINSDPTIMKLNKTDSGNLYFNSIQCGNQPAWCGPMVRLDWLADCGLDIPQTFDDWHTMLVAFRDQMGADAPMMLSQQGYNVIGFGLTPGFHTAGTYYAVDRETVKYGFLDDGMRDYLALMAQWYSEGLIDRDFTSHNPWVDASNLYTSDSTGAFDQVTYTARGLWPSLHTDEDDDIGAVPFPTKTVEEQGTLHFRRFNETVGDTPCFITTAAEARGVAELCAKWIDYHYCDDGAYLFNYGVEGKTWEMGEDGMPHFTEFYLTNEEYTSSEMASLWTYIRYSGFYWWTRENDMYSEEVLSAYDVWNGSSKGDWILPPVTMTAEEAEEYSSINQDIQTYVDEMVLRIIVGETSIDEWDSIVAEIEAMGIQDCIDIQQTALNRFNSR